MRGITPRPRPVTIQFLAVTATPGRALARPRPAAQHIRLIVKPESKCFIRPAKKAGTLAQEIMANKHLGR